MMDRKLNKHKVKVGQQLKCACTHTVNKAKKEKEKKLR